MGATGPGLVYVLPDGLTEPQAQAVADQLVYSSDDITGLRLSLGRRELLVRTRLEADRERLQAMIHRLVDDVSADNVQEGQVIWRTGSSVGGIADCDGDPAIHARLHRVYDRMFLEFAIRFGAAERVYPSMIDLAVLDRCRYVQQFPQNVYLVDELPHERDLLTRMRAGETDRESLRRSTPYLLNPALCFHTYAEFADSSVAGPVVLTMSGRCFRHEAPWRLDGFRMADFTMREIAYLGPPREVATLRQRLLEQTRDLFLELGLSGRIETATDPFYHAQDAELGKYQLLAKAKYELVVETPRGATAAIASFNNLQDSLCRQFAITGSGGMLLHSGCAAFGIDRWVRATLDQHGADPAAWPAQLRALD
jgi:seryl-tRNA synthetase